MALSPLAHRDRRRLGTAGSLHPLPGCHPQLPIESSVGAQGEMWRLAMPKGPPGPFGPVVRRLPRRVPEELAEFAEVVGGQAGLRSG